MKILLLIPPTDLQKSYGKLKVFANPQPSIGLAYIAAILRDNGHEVKVLDAYVESIGIDEIFDFMSQYSPDILGISALTPSAELIYAIAVETRKRMGHVKIVMGNLHATLFCEEILSNNYADFVVHGEGEYTMLELLKTLEHNGVLEDVKGLSFKRNGKNIHNLLRPPIEDLDALPFPAWDFFPLNKYSTDPRTQVKKHNVETMILATRGCPNQCTFCSSRTERSLGYKYRMRSPKSIVDEMVFMNKHYDSKVFSFMDLAFPLIKKHALDFCQEIIQRGIDKKFAWFTECRVKPLDEETLSSMKKAGCIRVCFGIESGNDETLKLLKKNFSTDNVKKAVRMSRQAGLEIDGMFMIGLPGENETMIRRTIDFALELDLRYAIFNIFVPYPGCELFDTLMAENKVHFERWSDFTSYPTYSGGKPVYVPDNLTHQGLMDLQKRAMRRFYLRPKFVYQEFKRFKLTKFGQYYSGLKTVLWGK